MKKTLIIMLTIIFCLSYCTAYANGTTGVTIDATWTNAAEMTAKEWYSDDTMRAALTISIWLDLKQAGCDFGVYPMNSAVGYNRESGSLIISMWDDENFVTTGYSPLLKYAQVWNVKLSTQGSGKVFAKKALGDSCDSYYINDSDTIMMVLQWFMDYLEG